jgi:hypothetical protein
MILPFASVAKLVALAKFCKERSPFTLKSPPVKVIVPFPSTPPPVGKNTKASVNGDTGEFVATEIERPFGIFWSVPDATPMFHVAYGTPVSEGIWSLLKDKFAKVPCEDASALEPSDMLFKFKVFINPIDAIDIFYNKFLRIFIINIFLFEF